MPKITRETIAALREEMETTFAALGQKHGVQLKFGRCQFGDVGLLKIDVAAFGDSGEVETREALDFKINAATFGLRADDLHREFSSMGRRFVLTGLRVRSRKMPFLAKAKDDGKVYTFTELGLKAALSRETRTGT